MALTGAQLDLENALYTIRQCWPDMQPDSGWAAAGSAHSNGSKPPVPMALLSDRRYVANVTRYNALFVLRNRAFCPIGDLDLSDVMDATSILLEHSAWLSHHFRGQTRELERAAEVCERWAKGLHVRRFPVGPCPEKDPDSEDRCKGILYAVLRQEDDLLPSQVRCDHTKGHVWSPSEWDALGRRIRGLDPRGVIALTRAIRA